MITGNPWFLLLLLIIFGAAFLLQLFYYLYFYLATVTFKPLTDNAVKAPVSVIICARNEEQNLREFLPSVLGQKYPEYEVIVVNDCSDDDSYIVLGEYIKKYPHLRVSNITKDPKFTHNKKFAQFIGIKAARHDLLLFTDADCCPLSDKWIEEMASHFDSETDFVLGYGGFFRKKGFLNKYIRCDSMFIAMQYLGMAIRGIPYMGVGRNLAYRRSLFFAHKGFGSFSHLASGDDDLFVNSHATVKNVSVEFREEAHTRSVPSASVNELFKQKRRHFTTANHYKVRDKILLLAEPVSRILFYVIFIVLVSLGYLWPFVTAIFVIRLALQVTVYILNQKKFNEPGIISWLLLFDIFSPLVNSIFFAANLGRGARKSRWN